MCSSKPSSPPPPPPPPQQAKMPDTGAIDAKRNKRKPGTIEGADAGTLLTGPAGVAPGSVPLGTSTLLGGGTK